MSTSLVQSDRYKWTIQDDVVVRQPRSPGIPDIVAPSACSFLVVRTRIPHACTRRPGIDFPGWWQPSQ